LINTAEGMKTVAEQVVAEPISPVEALASRAPDNDGAGGLRFSLREAAGGLGDLGIFIPLLAGMVKTCGLQLGPALLLAGAMNFATGIIFKIPMPVQPMKAIAAVAISGGMNEAQILTAGITCGIVLLVLGLTGSVDWLSRRIPVSVVRGLQLALGLSLIWEGVKMVKKTCDEAHSFLGWDSCAVGLICLVIALLFHKSKVFPAALVIFAIGLASLWIAHREVYAGLQTGFTWHLPDLGHWADWEDSFTKAVLPQLPLTLLNSVVAVCALSGSLFPRTPARPRTVAVSVAVMNLVCCPLGGMPMCHGAGGLAGQYRFGARSGGSIVMLGSAKMLLALVFGGSIGLLLQNYPNSVLGVLLAAGGLELAIVCKDQKGLRSLALVALTAVSCLTLGRAIGFVVGWMAAVALDYCRRPIAQ
jgi:hypothetical protein